MSQRATSNIGHHSWDRRDRRQSSQAIGLGDARSTRHLVFVEGADVGSKEAINRIEHTSERHIPDQTNLQAGEKRTQAFGRINFSTGVKNAAILVEPDDFQSCFDNDYGVDPNWLNGFG